MKLSQYAKKIGITYKTAWNWYNQGLIPNSRQIENGTIIVDDEIKKTEYGVILYARTSSSKNKQLLEDQAKRLENYAIARGYRIKNIIKEFGSGLNDERKQLSKILLENKYDKIIVENKDRLTRFGFNWFKIMTNDRIEVINESKEKDEDLVKDLISIIHCFSSRIYGLRRSKNIKNRVKEVIHNAVN